MSLLAPPLPGTDRRQYRVGETLVPKTTPPGPQAARIAWATALDLAIVVLDERAGIVRYTDGHSTRGWRQACRTTLEETHEPA